MASTSLLAGACKYLNVFTDIVVLCMFGCYHLNLRTVAALRQCLVSSCTNAVLLLPTDDVSRCRISSNHRCEAIRDQFATMDELRAAWDSVGLDSVNMILAVDFTAVRASRYSCAVLNVLLPAGQLDAEL